MTLAALYCLRERTWCRDSEDSCVMSDKPHFLWASVYSLAKQEFYNSSSVDLTDWVRIKSELDMKVHSTAKE